MAQSIDTGLVKAASQVLTAEKWKPIVEKALQDAAAGDHNARDFLIKLADASW